MKGYEKIIAIDLSYSLHRCLRQPNLWDLVAVVKDDEGKITEVHTGGVYGVFNSLLKVMKLFPDYRPVFASDKGLSPRRLALQPNYKHTADKRAQKEIPEFELTEEQLQERKESEEYMNAYVWSKHEIAKISKALGIPYIEIDQTEGDDILACLTCFKGTKEVVVVTDDRDLYQLLGIKSQGVINYRALADEVVYQKQFFEEFGSIDNFVLHKSLCGDGSDNIPQIAKGVGGKTAMNFINTLREAGFTNETISQKSRLISGDFDGGQKFEGRGKNKKLVADDTPITDNPALNHIIQKFSTKASRSFVRALCESEQLRSNLHMIDLRFIDVDTFIQITEDYISQVNELHTVVPSIFSVIPLFSRLQIKELNLTELVNRLKTLKGM